MRKVDVFQTLKGGVGCTVSAVGYACALADKTGRKVTLICLQDDDAKSVMYTKYEDIVNIVVYDKPFTDLVADVDAMETHVVIDAGSIPLKRNAEWASHLVVENHYLSLRRMTMTLNYKERFDDLVLVYDKSAVLSMSDVQKVSGLPIFLFINRDEKIARSVDAGLFPRNDQFVHFISEPVRTGHEKLEVVYELS